MDFSALGDNLRENTLPIRRDSLIRWRPEGALSSLMLCRFFIALSRGHPLFCSLPFRYFHFHIASLPLSVSDHAFYSDGRICNVIIFVPSFSGLRKVGEKWFGYFMHKLHNNFHPTAVIVLCGRLRLSSVCSRTMARSPRAFA